MGRPAGAGARLHRRRRAAYRQAARRLAYFRSAKPALRRLHRAGICHNDLAKEQNWLRGSDGRAYLTDFQLAVCFKRRSRLFRIAAYEDLRHLLKHKRSYAPEALTPKERKILARKSLVTAHLAGDRQEGLSGDHPRPVQFHRPRGRRPAPGQ